MNAIDRLLEGDFTEPTALLSELRESVTRWAVAGRGNLPPYLGLSGQKDARQRLRNALIRRAADRLPGKPTSKAHELAQRAASLSRRRHRDEVDALLAEARGFDRIDLTPRMYFLIIGNN